MTSADLEAIRRIVDAFERSDWQEIDVRWGELRVHLVSTASSPASASPLVQPAAPSTGSAPPAHAGTEEGPAQAPRPTPVTVPGAHVVTAPSPGIFWRAPEPGAPPFTDVGQAVEPASTLCIIEVMKLMSRVKAGVSGEVVAIYAENGVAVAKDEPLFAVATGGAGA